MLRTRRQILSMTPMIDVVFLLLLFFLITTQIGTQQSIPLNSKGTSASATTTPTLLEIGNELLLNGAPITEAQWLAHLQNTEPKTIAIRPSLTTSSQELIKRIDQARKSGWEEIILVENQNAQN